MRNLALSVALLFLFCPIILIGQLVQPFDILITELMIDPNPVVGLPNLEWIELHNASDQTIDLEDLRYSSGSIRYKLPAYTLAPGGYVMLCDDSDIDALRAFGEAIDIKTFPSLTNAGDAATLENADDNLIHEVRYEKSWYGDTDKDDGGYTLELINPNDPCLAASNWMASSSPTGATPAAENSNWMPSTPYSGIIAERVVAKSGSEIQVQFDRLPSMSVSEMEFSLSLDIAIVDITSDDDDPRLLSLHLGSALSSSTVYTLIISSEISDCLGLSSGTEQAIEFVLPEAIEVGDLVINEVLFDPIGSESDFVEIYNAGNKFLNISPLMIGNLDPVGSGSTRAIDVSYILAPMEYLVLTEDAIALTNRYTTAIADKIIEVDLPSFDNTDGNVSLLVEDNGTEIVIDALNYDEDMHSAFIDDPEGVSLERVDASGSSADRTNWQSGAASTGYGSPTLPNSQRVGLTEETDALVYLEQKTFFPQNQMDNLLSITFQIDRSDYIGTIDVFDSAGRHIHQLANNLLIGRNDRYYWDGLDQNGNLLHAGVYVVVVQLVAMDGNIVTKKLPCVLSRSL